MKKYIAIVLLLVLLFSIAEPLTVFANGEKSETVKLDLKNIGDYAKDSLFTYELDAPKDFGELVSFSFSEIEPNTTKKIERVEYDAARNKLIITFKMDAPKVAEVNGYRDSEKLLFQGTPYNAVCRYSDGARWQFNEMTRKDNANQKFISVYRIEDLASSSNRVPTNFIYDKYRLTGSIKLEYERQSVGFWVDSNGTVYTNNQIDTATKHVKKDSVKFPAGMQESRVDFSFYDEKNKPLLAYQYLTVTPGTVYNSMENQATQFEESNDATVPMTGHAKCYKYINQVEYHISAKTKPVSNVVGTFTYRYKASDEPKIIASIEANPSTVKFNGETVTVDVTLKAEVVNIKAGAITKYIMYLRTEDNTQNPKLEGYEGVGKTLKTEVTAPFTIPASKLNNKEEFTEYFVGRVHAITTNAKAGRLISELVKTSTLVYKNSPITEVKEDHEIVAKIDGNKVVKLGADTFYNAFGSYSTNSTIEGYRWELPNAMVQPSGAYEAGEVTFQTWYDKLGTERAIVYVIDKEGRQAGAFMDIEVVEPTIEVRINTSGTLKENRKVTISALVDSPKRYPLTKITWQVKSLTGDLDHAIHHASSLDGQLSFDALFKKAGEYIITANVENAAGYTNQATYIVDIKEDKKPVAEFKFQDKVYRDPAQQNKATFELTDYSYSFDGDYIAQRNWYVIFDANNDGIFNEPKVLFNSGNNKVVTYQSSHVGKYRFILEVIEEFGEPTINEYVTAADRRRTSTDER